MNNAIRWTGRIVLWGLFAVLALLLALRAAAWARETDTSAPAATGYVETPYGRVAVTVTGPASGQAVLLVHGTAAWGGFWQQVADSLAERGYRAVAIDLPPFGYSDHDPKARYDRATQAARIAAVAEAHGGNAFLVGHSFGAGAATEAALRYPDRLSRLVLVDAALGRLDPQGGRGTLAEVADAAPVAQLAVAALVTNPAMTGTMLKSFMYRDEAAERWLDVLRQPMHRPGATAAYGDWLPQLVTANDASLSRKSAELRKIAVPVSIIWGEMDDVTPPDQGREIARLTKADPMILLPGVGHIPHAEDPASFMPALLRAIAPPSVN